MDLSGPTTLPIVKNVGSNCLLTYGTLEVNGQPTKCLICMEMLSIWGYVNPTCTILLFASSHSSFMSLSTFVSLFRRNNFMSLSTFISIFRRHDFMSLYTFMSPYTFMSLSTFLPLFTRGNFMSLSTFLPLFTRENFMSLSTFKPLPTFHVSLHFSWKLLRPKPIPKKHTRWTLDPFFTWKGKLRQRDLCK